MNPWQKMKGVVSALTVLGWALSGCATQSTNGATGQAENASPAITAVTASESVATQDSAVAPLDESLDRLSPTRLVLVAEYGQNDQVRYLLERGVHVDSRDVLGKTPLMAAAAAGQQETVMLLLKAGADVKAKSQYGDTALMAAAIRGDAALINTLLKAGAEIDALNDQGESALFAAVAYGHLAAVETLLAQGANPNLRNTQPGKMPTAGFTPLHYVARHGLSVSAAPWDKIAGALLSKNANPNILSTDGNSVLGLALRTGDSALAEQLRRAGARDDSVYAGLIPDEALIKAAARGDAAKVKELLRDAARPNAADQNGVTPLLGAALGGHLTTVEALIAAGAKLDSVPNGLTEIGLQATRAPLAELPLLEAAARGDTALLAAIRHNHVSVVQALLAAGADTTRVNRRNEAPILVAAEVGNPQVVSALLAKGASANAREHDNYGGGAVTMALGELGRNTPLIVAAQRGHADVVSALLAGGAQIDAVGLMDRTALAWAVERGQVPVVRLLIAGGANVNVSDMTGQTPLMLAAGNGNETLVALLLQGGAEINAIASPSLPAGSGKIFGAANQTALMLAAAGGHKAVVQQLLAAGVDVATQGRQAVAQAQRNGYDAVAAQLQAALGD